MEKYLIIFIILIVLYYLHKCWVENLIDAKVRKENFSNSSGGGADDSTAIQALGAIAKDLMSGGGLKVPGDTSFAGVANFAKDIKVAGTSSVTGITKSTGGIEISNKWGIYDSGDDWIRLNKIGGKGTQDYYGGFAAGKLWTNDSTINGRNIFAELDDLKANSVRKDKQYYIDIGVRANGDGCCGNGSGLIIHNAGPNGHAAAWSDKSVTTRFTFRQV